MSDALPYFAAESGTYSTTGPSVNLSGAPLQLGTYPSRTFAEADTDTTTTFSSGNTCTVVIIKDTSNYKRYTGAIWTDASPDTLGLATATLAGSAGTISNGDSVTVYAALPDSVVNGGALGTPSSGTLTHCTALPLGGIVSASAASRLLGRGSASGAGAFEELTVGNGLGIVTLAMGLKLIGFSACADGTNAQSIAGGTNDITGSTGALRVEQWDSNSFFDASTGIFFPSLAGYWLVGGTGIISGQNDGNVVTVYCGHSTDGTSFGNATDAKAVSCWRGMSSAASSIIGGSGCGLVYANGSTDRWRLQVAAGSAGSLPPTNQVSWAKFWGVFLGT